MTLIAPGAPLICIREHPQVPDGLRKTVNALYFCETLGVSDDGQICPYDGCGPIGIGLKGFRTYFGMSIFHCPNDFKPLNDGDTSLVDDEVDAPTDVLEDV